VNVSRRRFLTGSAAAVGAAGLGVAGGSRLGGDSAAAAPKAPPNPLDLRIPFDGPHQAGILNAGQAQATYAALDVIAPNAGQLAAGLQALSSKARQLTAGSSIIRGDVDDPPSDSGILGPEYVPDGLTVTIGFGATLYDDRFGLKAPAGLRTMPSFANDKLDPARCHGDVLLQICANQRDTVVHALREIMRPIRGTFVLRWTLDGFQSAERSKGSKRNLFGFRDGTSNPDVRDDAAMKRLIWTPEGGTFQVVRAIRMHVEFWDRVGLREQENMIGRTRDTGAPLGGTDEFQDPRFDTDARGDRIPLDAHIRLANPRTDQTADERILRRAFNYTRGFDDAGQLDQGLIFTAFNQDIERQFATIQKRLDSEPMIDYITPVGGGYYYVPPGSRSPGDYVGSGLFT
jgi:deferrochelatase/peroxidase EfeB